MVRNAVLRVSAAVGNDPRRPVGARPAVFPNTGARVVRRVERPWAPWARWEGGALGGSGVSLWRVRLPGGAIDLVSAGRWSDHLPPVHRGGMGLTFRRHDAAVHGGQGTQPYPFS